MSKLKRIISFIFVLIFSGTLLILPVYADTDGTEIEMTRQPDQLILQLGSTWAGVEFTLKTDAGIFPAPIKVDERGVLQMDLGGSKTYTLSCVSSTTLPLPETQEKGSPINEDKEQKDTTGIPILHLLLFLGGLIVAIFVLVAIYISKRRREYDEDEDYDEDDEE